MSTNSALDQIMDQAEQAAGNHPAPVPMANNLPTPANDTGVGALAKPTMDDFLDGGMDVDAYFRVKPEGFRIGDDMQGLIEELTVEIDLSEIAPIYSFRCELGGSTKFIKSYNGTTTPDNKNFQAEVDRLTRLGEKPSGVYQSAEVPVTLLEDLADPKKGSSLVITEGTRVGYTPSVTAFKPLQSFLKRLRQQDPSLLQQTVTVKLTHVKRKKGNFEWGVLNFELVEG